MQNFLTMKEKSLEKIEYEMPIDQLFSLMEFKYLKTKKNSKISEREYIYVLNSTSLGPFDYPENETKEFLNSISEFKVNYTLKTYIPFYYADNLECFNWVIFLLLIFS
jgi:hypothetical protein